MVVDFIIIVVGVDVVLRVDGEEIRFVARASMGKGYHARLEIQAIFKG